MNPNDEMETFLRDGYERYAEAKEAVTTFEREIQERLMRQLEAKLKLGWSNFHAQRVERGRGKAVQAGLSVESGLPSILAWHNDADGNSIYLGFEWGTLEPRRPTLFTDVWGSGFSKLYLSDPKSPVQSHGEGFLFVIVGDGFELEPMAALLLSETDRALARVKSVKRRRPDAAT